VAESLRDLDLVLRCSADAEIGINGQEIRIGTAMTFAALLAICDGQLIVGGYARLAAYSRFDPNALHRVVFGFAAA
jgi:hypothetical protein